MSIVQHQYYLQMLKKNICEISYVNPYDPKAVIHTLNGTLLPQYVENCNNGINYTKQFDDMLNFVNIDKDEWKTIRTVDIRSFKLVSGSLSDLTTQPITRPATSKYAQVMPNKKEMDIQPTMTIKHNLNETIKAKLLAAKKPVDTSIPAQQRWMLDMLHNQSALIAFEDNHGVMHEVTASLEFWVLALSPFEPKSAVEDPNIMKVIDMEDGKWISIPFDKIRMFKTDKVTYIPDHTRPDVVVAPILPANVTTNAAIRKQHYRGLLQNTICRVEFVKADGTLRVMNCTLEPKTIVALHLEPKGTKNANSIEKDEDDNIIRVVDVDKQDWRTITIDKIKSFTTYEIKPQPLVVPTTNPTRVTSMSTHV